MFNEQQHKKNLIVLGSLIFILILIYISQVWLLPTLSRYIFREEDEIRAHYTALYFASTGEGKTIALESNVGYIDFDLRNYIGENVTQRDIVYTISKPSVFYDKFGNVINPVEIESYLSNPDNDLHVLDVWGNPQKVSRSTYLYDVEIVKNSGEVVSSGVYTFTYEKLGSSAVGKVHNVTCKVTRTDNLEPQADTISLVVQLSKPYKEVLIINMNVSTHLITFAHKEIKMFDIQFDKLYIQSADLFANYKDANNTPRIYGELDKTHYQFTSNAFKLTITWSGYVFDEDKLEEIHIGTSPYPGGDKINDSLLGNPNGASPNDEIDKPYIDVKKSTIAYINSSYDATNGHRGELVIFIPQSSDIYLLFLKTATTGTIDVKIESYVSTYDAANLTSTNYQIYNETLGGYKFNDDAKYNLANYN